MKVFFIRPFCFTYEVVVIFNKCTTILEFKINVAKFKFNKNSIMVIYHNNCGSINKQ